MRPTIAELMGLISDAKAFHDQITATHQNVTLEEVQWAIQLWWMTKLWAVPLPKK